MNWTTENRRPEDLERVAALLGEIRAKAPQLRIGQIIANATPPGTDLFYVHDEASIVHLEKFLETIPESKRGKRL